MRELLKSFLLRAGALCNCRDSRVIYYHDVFEKTRYTDMGTPLSIFQNHIKIASEMGFHFVDEITSPKRQLQICFDDGFRGIWDTREYFYHNGLRPTVFVPICLIGREGYLNKNEILELQERGFVFQGHSWNHDNLPHYNKVELRHELWDAKVELENLLGKEVDSICFPQGYFSDQVILSALEAGYRKLYSSLPGAWFDQIGQGNLSFLKPRSFVQGVSLRDFCSIIQGGDKLLRTFRIRKHYQ